MAEPDNTALPREELIRAVERTGPRRVPLDMAHWWGEGLIEQYGERLEEFDRYPEDTVRAGAGIDFSRMNLSWYDPAGPTGAKDAGGVLSEWEDLDEFIEKLPAPEASGRLDDCHGPAGEAHAENRYLIFGVWHFFFERPWMIRGMENIMMDYYLNPERVHRLHDALCRQYEGLIRRAVRELRPDAFSTSDDLGNQRQLMMKPDHFREFLKPYYARIGKLCHELGLHFWLHSCGNNTEIMEDLIEVGLDVFHPVQKHTMDETVVAREFGDRLTFHAGFDVQQTLRWGTPEDVRREVRFLIDTFDRADGGMIMAAGNGIVSGTPFENIEAFLDESLRYGTEHREKMDA